MYKRQVLTTKEKPAGRVDDPDLAEKMKAEVEGILLLVSSILYGVERKLLSAFSISLLHKKEKDIM